MMEEHELIASFISENESARGVSAPRTWFELDAYGAAVHGILKSIRLGLESGSLGQGDEEETLRAVLDKLLEMDAAIQLEGDWWKT